MKLKLARLAAAALCDKDGRKTARWILVTTLSPLILIVIFLCALGSGEADHNTNMVYACFYGAELSEYTPRTLRGHVSEMREAFSLLDSAVYAVNAQMENGDSLDSARVKAVFLGALA